MKKMRLDKILANSGLGSRKDVKGLIKTGRVTVSAKSVKDPALVIDVDSETIAIDGEVLEYREFYYLMMNKPAGVISATWDKEDETVIDILPDFYKNFELFPVGRLDKDTEGLLILTNDGQLAHQLLSPKKMVPKTYYATVEGQVEAEDIKIFNAGILLDKDFTTLPARLEIIEADKMSKVFVTICEGKFHQVKRMFEAVGKKVVYLKRLSMGSLRLDESLPLGSVRELTADEINILKG